jgi:hypothetical protein
MFIPYRCGDTVVAAFMPGPVSAGVFAVAMVCSAGLLLARLRRRRRAHWY